MLAAYDTTKHSPANHAAVAPQPVCLPGVMEAGFKGQIGRLTDSLTPPR
jgi:hypothetical protein